jgi:hypothetical protein
MSETRWSPLESIAAPAHLSGYMLFTVASVPYLWLLDTEVDRRVLYGFLAWQHVIGSVLFLAGGVFNYWRAYIVIRAELAGQSGQE